MYKYVFTNDFRMYSKEQFEQNVTQVANQIISGEVPQDKSENNVFNVYSFFLSLKKHNGQIANGVNRILNDDIESVLHNFIRKFQYPNKRTKACLVDSVEHSVELVPLRTILKLLYLQYISNGDEGYLTKNEIEHFVFYNQHLVHNRHLNLIEVLHEVQKYRETDNFPDHIQPHQFELKQRHYSNFLGILIYSSFVKEEKDRYSLNANNFTEKNWSNFLKIVMEDSFLACTLETTDDEYYGYMDIEAYYENQAQGINENTKLDHDPILKPHNRILFGAPGTGKSHKLEKERIPFGENYERVTFHPNYSYSQFVGTYKPKPKFKDDKEYISYEFVPGPFLRVWINAMKSQKTSPSEKHLLIIEEINRSNVAAVFGDVFQLLDRNENGASEYTITPSEELRNFLVHESGFSPEEVQVLSIPSNMYLWGTMNSADQGVYPMDTAFKRRWSFEYIGIDDGENKLDGVKVNLKFEKEPVSWNLFRKKINKRLTESDLNVNEDKLIGPFFLSGKDLAPENYDGVFKSKLLMYLFEDVLKNRSGKFFVSGLNTFSKILQAYDSGKVIFDFKLRETISSQPKELLASDLIDIESDEKE
ncbi:AAA family ATPase [Rossellomorea sp. NPDC071047]|uniref:AAA family ATPase n=1 Tax=Rossellomorea sp. NPDC071047 TaxID=3390675 RepID=UPI003CFE57CE